MGALFQDKIGAWLNRWNMHFWSLKSQYKKFALKRPCGEALRVNKEGELPS